MKVGVLFLLLILLMQFSTAEIEVFNITVDNISSSIERVSGEINISITQEDANTLITSNAGDEITISEFLEKSGVNYECTPTDCSSRYTKASEEPVVLVELSPGQKKILGFAIEGAGASINELSFKFASDFVESTNIPLKAKIFENQEWEFNEFSENIFSVENWGCFDVAANSEVRNIGSQVGPTPFCEDVYLTKTDKVQAGAYITLNGSNPDESPLLQMTLHYKNTGSEAGHCSYDPQIEGESGNCIMSLGSEKFFEEGEYKICVSSEEVTGYKIYNEQSGDICGSVLTGSSSSPKDYSVFVQTAKYANHGSLGLNFNSTELEVKDLANEYIEQKYKNDCSDTCILPIELFAGIPQNFLIEDPFLQYFANDEYDTTTNIYEISEAPAKISYEGVLNLGLLNFSIPETMDYEINIGNTKVFNKTFSISSAPKINFLVPTNPPAGVPIKFTTDVTFDGNRSLLYNWDFGDETTNQTSVNYIDHIYHELRNYTIKLKVDAGGGLSDEKEFNVQTVTPKSAIENNLALKRELLSSLTRIIDSVPPWYKQALSDKAKIDSISDNLNSIEKSQQAATVDSDYISIVMDLYRLEVPSSIEIESYDMPYLMNSPEDVNIAPISETTGDVATSSNEEYKKPIISWQNKNIEGEVSTRIYEVKLQTGETLDTMTTYSFNIKSNSPEESYFVIDKKLSELHFSKSVGAGQVSDYSVVPIQASDEKSIEFYYSGSEPVSYFVSPKLSSITIESGIDTSCNYNFICEKNLGEDSTNCRSDCLPTGKLVLYIILIIIGSIGIYSLLGLWYNKHYENYLFKDKRELFNIIMFVSNAKARGMSDGKISANLRRQGWSSERVSYILKKANGKRTGLPEIIPISKISAKIRNAKARKQVAKQAKNNVMTDPRQQSPQNINKSRFTRRL